ncbi:hypothetical protein C8D94_101579 [Marinirhabdus gelatinilytica]|uniref:Uncharacterized protein n=1 Tax=Marinirhabdus gelatinilytica TaxID=1703343 RepID=A0A370QK02_9FLAO|nr:hypothetical protein C8D94_101579 [Marinirhabdus gelatinilytica]
MLLSHIQNTQPPVEDDTKNNNKPIIELNSPLRAGPELASGGVGGCFLKFNQNPTPDLAGLKDDRI